MSVLSLNEALRRVEQTTGRVVSVEILESLIAASLLPLFSVGDQRVVLSEDIQSLATVLVHLATHPPKTYLGRDLFSGGIPAEIKLGCGTTLSLVENGVSVPMAFYAAARNLVQFCAESGKLERGTSTCLPFFPPTAVETNSDSVIRRVGQQRERAERCCVREAGHFANSAYYMGSKRLLADYLVEGVSSILPDDGVVLDLMCGSGAASSIFNKSWETWASDAMKFCQLLATVQGGGYSERRADAMLDVVLPLAREHSRNLKQMLGDVLNREDELFHGNLDMHLLSEYRRFLTDVPTYPSDLRYQNWCPTAEVESRKGDWRKAPYCLFTAYFANVYFGVRQSVEIDSLRFAIDHLDDEIERRWALGALIAAVSAQGTTYAGHFAQPVVKKFSDLTLKRLAPLLERRASSILHEFSIRLTNLARESEGVERSINVINGPWRDAITTFKRNISDRVAVVYLDAPYKREEYSRYYHVLETLVAYNYPSSVGRGRVPDRKLGEFFQSEFFTRSRSRMEAAFVSVITDILDRGWHCAWSYSDNGNASIPSVIDSVAEQHPSRVRSFAAPFEHKPQGGQPAKRVTEYLILFET